MAGSGLVTAFAGRLEDYLQLRRSLGHKLETAGRLLPGFVAYLDAIGAETVTVSVALAWAQQPETDPTTSVRARRMGVVRGFARYMAGIDPRTQVPPAGLVTYRQRRRQPYLYSPADVRALMRAARRGIALPLRAATMETIIGLLATTGMRVGEAIRLDSADLNWDEGWLAVLQTKFRKSRQLPLHPSTMNALARYTRTRDRLAPLPDSPAFFISTTGTRLLYPNISLTFRTLVRATGIGAGSSSRPRIHDLRHSFAVQTLTDWAREGSDIQARLPWLSTYLGHTEPRYTYGYLSAAPELLMLAAQRLHPDRQDQP